MKPPLSDRTRLLESIHLALTAWGLEPDEDILMPFNLFCKHWTYLLLYQFPDQYSDTLRLLMQSKCLLVVIDEIAVNFHITFSILQISSKHVKVTQVCRSLSD